MNWPMHPLLSLRPLRTLRLGVRPCLSSTGNGGELNGVRILSPATVHLMSSNHLASNLLTGELGIGLQIMRPGFGYGYDCAVIFNPPQADLVDGRGHSSGMEPPARGSGSTRRMTWFLWG
jgi:hypothetical protein